MFSMTNKPVISVKNIFVVALVVIISFIFFKLLTRDASTSYMVYGNIFTVILNLLVILTLFYATIRSASSGRRVQIAWMFITIAYSFFTLGDILELSFFIKTSLPIYDIFYIMFYLIFAVGIYFLPRFSFTRNEKLKIFLDIGIIIITVGLIFWIFLIIPALANPVNPFKSDISVIYIIGYLVLFFVLLRGIYSKFDDYYLPILLLSMGILALIVTDIIYAFQTVDGTYISGGLLEIGWTISFILSGLAAFLQASDEKIELKKFSLFKDRMQKSNLIYYIPFFWVLIAFIILVWSNNNIYVPHYEVLEVVVGVIVVLVVIRQFITLKENNDLLAKAEKEVESRKLAEKLAHENEIYYKAIFENTGTSIIIVDHDMTISRINSETEILTGYTKDEIEGRKKWTDFVITEDLDRFKGYYVHKNNSTQRSREYETQVRDKDGNIKDLLVTVVNIPATQKLLASIIDITRRKNTENVIKSSLNEKSILLQEIHHRVKNNMQIISSLLNLQTKYVSDEKAIDVLKESQNRVRSMAMIHEKLYLSKDLSHINFGDYIQSLVTNLFYSYNIEKTQIKPKLEVTDLNLNMDTAVPCGLIISELVSNSLKYAFPNGMNGEIFVSLKFVDNKYEMIIRDNGVGMSDEIDFNNLETLGLLLVNSLTEQIDGEMTINRIEGTEFMIRFDEIKYKNRM
jgi:two-component system, sensor histidine kinase PdtaS